MRLVLASASPARLAVLRAAGVEPRLDRRPQLRRALLFGPLAPSCFRLDGPDALPDAESQFARQAAAFGAITSGEMTLRGNVKMFRKHG